MTSYHPLHFINHIQEDEACEFSDDAGVGLLDQDGDEHGASLDADQCRKRTHAQAFHTPVHSHHTSPRVNPCSENRIGPKKLTRGKQKIPIEFIHDRARRYSTFSKRKTGLMKKASELAQLTGAQVLLLIASETNHVYTFATPRLKDIVNLNSGKELIRTCLMGPRVYNKEVSLNEQAKSTSTLSLGTEEDFTEAADHASCTHDETVQDNPCDDSVSTSLNGGPKEHEHSPNNSVSDLTNQVHPDDDLSPIHPLNSVDMQNTFEASLSHSLLNSSCHTVVNQEETGLQNTTAPTMIAINCNNLKTEPAFSLSCPLNNSTGDSLGAVQLVLLSQLNSHPCALKNEKSAILGGCTGSSAITPPSVVHESITSQPDRRQIPSPLPNTPSACIISPMPRRTLLPKKSS